MPNKLERELAEKDKRIAELENRVTSEQAAALAIASRCLISTANLNGLSGCVEAVEAICKRNAELEESLAAMTKERDEARELSQLRKENAELKAVLGNAGEALKRTRFYWPNRNSAPGLVEFLDETLAAIDAAKGKK